MRIILSTGLVLLLAACASVSPRAELRDNFVEFGVSEERAACLADELDERLDRSDLTDVADYINGLNSVDTAGEALDALIRIDNPRAAAAIGSAGLACAFSGGD